MNRLEYYLIRLAYPDILLLSTWDIQYTSYNVQRVIVSGYPHRDYYKEIELDLFRAQGRHRMAQIRLGRDDETKTIYVRKDSCISKRLLKL